MLRLMATTYELSKERWFWISLVIIPTNQKPGSWNKGADEAVIGGNVDNEELYSRYWTCCRSVVALNIWQRCPRRKLIKRIKSADGERCVNGTHPAALTLHSASQDATHTPMTSLMYDNCSSYWYASLMEINIFYSNALEKHITFSFRPV